jgi:hypothetical protein
MDCSGIVMWSFNHRLEVTYPSYLTLQYEMSRPWNIMGFKVAWKLRNVSDCTIVSDVGMTPALGDLWDFAHAITFLIGGKLTCWKVQKSIQVISADTTKICDCDKSSWIYLCTWLHIPGFRSSFLVAAKLRAKDNFHIIDTLFGIQQKWMLFKYLLP